MDGTVSQHMRIMGMNSAFGAGGELASLFLPGGSF